MEQLFQKYKNIQLFAVDKKYRNYEIIDNFYNYEEFKSKMQTLGYVMHKFKSAKIDNEIDIYLFKEDSSYINSTSNFKKLMDRYNKPSNIIMFTKQELSVYRKKTIKLYKNINVKNYLHKHFIIELNKGPLCSKHTILTSEETREVCYDLMAHAHKLPSIFQDDPQAIWIGAEINDVVKIESISEITGKSLHYRIVTPTSGKIMQSSGFISQNKTENKDTEVSEIVEESDKKNIKPKESDNESEVELDHDEDYIDDFIEE
jgi:DNA-directed RNA polymerase subunit H (RpoH/RPB5)